MLNEKNLIPNPSENFDSDSEGDDDDEVDAAFEAKILANLSHQFEKNQNQMQQFFSLQTKASVNLFKKMSEFVDVTKLIFHNANNNGLSSSSSNSSLLPNSSSTLPSSSSSLP
jgi:spore coat protein CotH